MSEFYKKHCLNKSGEGPGGKFNGPSIKYILREDNFFYLENRYNVFFFVYSIPPLKRLVAILLMAKSQAERSDTSVDA